MQIHTQMNNTGAPGADAASGRSAAAAAMYSASGSSPGAPTAQLDEQLDLDLKLESLTLETETTFTSSTSSYHHQHSVWQQPSSSSSSSSSYNAYTHHQATRESLLSLQYSEHAHAVLTLDQQRYPYQSHARSRSQADLPLNPISNQPSLPPSLTTTPDSPIARSVPLPSVEDFASRPSSPWQADFPDPESPSPSRSRCAHPLAAPGAGHEHCCEPVYRNRLLDMVRDEFGSALELDDASSVASGSTHGLELDGMSRTVSRSASRSVSRSNTIRSVRSAVSKASTSRGISPQPTIVLSLEGDDDEMLHEGTDDGATGAQRSFRPVTASSLTGENASDAAEGALDASEAREPREARPEASEARPEAQGAQESSEACAHVPRILSVAELRVLQLPPSWPRVSLLSAEKLVIDRRVHSASATAGTGADPDFGMVPLDIPEFQLGDAAIDIAAGGSSLGSQLGSSVGSSTSTCSRISRDRKGSIETACSSLASCPPACTAGGAEGPVFGRDFAARLMLELYRASLLKSPVASPLNSPSQSPSTGTATAWWGGGLSVRAAAREVLREAAPEPLPEPLPEPQNGNGSLGLGFDANADVQELVLPDSDGSNCSTPIAAAAPRNKPVVTETEFKLEGKAFEFDPPFSSSETEILSREITDLIAGIDHYPAHYGSPEINGHVPYAHYATCDLSARLADPRAASLGPLAPELATTRPSTPPDTPTVGCAPLPALTAPVTPIQTRPSSPTVLQKAVAINAALAQLARSPLTGPLGGMGERSSRLDEMRRQSLRAAGVISPASSSSSPAPPGVRRKSLEWAKMTPRSSGEYARDIFGGLLRDSGPNVSVSQPSSPEFLKRKLAGAAVGEWDLSTTESAPGSPKSSRRNTLSGLGLFLSRARTKQK